MATIAGTLQGVLRRPTTVEGLWGWITTVDAKRVGILYGVTAVLFFLGGGIMALVMRVQLAQSEQSIVSPATFNALFTMHGTVMVFLVVMPLNAAFFNFVVPLQLGARDVAFPRLNALSYWLFLSGGLMLYASFINGNAPDAGWFSYANLTEKTFSPDRGILYWAVGLQILGVATMMASFNFIVTIINARARGMTFFRMPMFVWMTLVTSVLAVLAFPVITVALVELIYDRLTGTSFFVPSGGGDPILWQHLFWIFGHPEVYILILPAMGMVSEIIPVFSRKPLFGYKAVAMAGVFIAVTGFAVWSHHMFAVGLGPIPNSYFAAATMLVGVPTGVKIFNWLATLWGGQLSFKTPMLFALGFIAMFTVGGLSGVMHAQPPSDLQQTDTYFIVAHFHYVLFGGALFGLVGGFYYWFPKITGRLMSERLGILHFVLMFIGSNLAFFPMHLLGMWGMPRRISTYDSSLGFDTVNALVTAGAFLMAISFLVMLYNIFYSLKRGERAGNDPWDGDTLEWTTSSPPPVHNFDTLPVVRSSRPFFDLKHPELAENPPPPEALAPRPARHRHIHLPSPSYWPLVMAVGMSLAGYGVIYGRTTGGAIAIAVGLVLAMMAIYSWFHEPPIARAHR